MQRVHMPPGSPPCLASAEPGQGHAGPQHSTSQAPSFADPGKPASLCKTTSHTIRISMLRISKPKCREVESSDQGHRMMGDTWRGLVPLRGQVLVFPFSSQLSNPVQQLFTQPFQHLLFQVPCRLPPGQGRDRVMWGVGKGTGVLGIVASSW